MRSIRGVRKSLAWLSMLAMLAVFFAAGMTQVTTQPAFALDNGLALTPPMGWNSWNKFGCNVSEDLIKGMADSIVSSGLKDAGYRYVVIDDCWQVSRAADGTIVSDAARFPSGIKALADYVHAKGLKFGIYTDAGTATCQGRPGSYGHEQQDMATYAAWGVDYVKIDWCNSAGLNPVERYPVFRDAIKASGRAILFSICNWGVQNPWDWGPATGNMWRSTGDISDQWNSMISIFDSNAAHANAAGPGGWNDPDMLEVGNGGMTDTEYRTHLSLWAIAAAPLIAGNDIRNMSAATREILTNDEVIAVDQDSLGVQGVKVWDNLGGLQVWSKRLSGTGKRAVVLLNRNSAPADIPVSWADIGLTGRAAVRDLWAHNDLGSLSRGYTAKNIPGHGAVMLTVSGREAVTVEAESPANALGGSAAVSNCGSCSGGKNVGNVGNNSGTLTFQHISVGDRGQYYATLSYLNGDPARNVYVSVNGGPAMKHTLTSSGGFNSVRNYSFAVELHQGENTIALSNPNPGQYAPDVDKLTVSDAPTAVAINGTASPAANSTGWNNAPVTVSFACAGGLAPLDCAPPVTVSKEGAEQSVTGTVTDSLGNKGRFTVGGINIDLTRPDVAITRTPANANGWNNTPVTVSFTCADKLSGVAWCSGPAAKYEAESPANTLGAGARIGGCATCSGGKKVGYVGNQTGTLTFHSISVSEDGTYIVALYYGNGDTRDVYVSVNGGPAAKHTLGPTGGFDTIGAYTLSLNLNAGNNSITLSNPNPGQYAPDFDYITVAAPSTRTLGTEGAGQVVTGSAGDKAGNVTDIAVSDINIDLTAPTVAYAGNAGSYTVDQTVQITCSATDALSGVASSTCKEIAGPAYSFPLGANNFTATAADKAGNTGSSATSFTVTVTYASLRNVVKQFAAKDGVAQSLTAKLDAAEAAEGRGDAQAKAGALQGFVHEVDAQKGKALTSDQADVLSRLAQAL